MGNKERMKKGPRLGTWEYARLRAKKRAKEYLRDKHVRCTISLCTAFIMLAVAGVSALVHYIASILIPAESMDSFGSVTLEVLCASLEFAILLLLISPLVFGLHAYALGVVRKNADASESVFSFYSSKARRAFAYRRSLASLLRILLVSGLVIAECNFGIYMSQPLVNSGDVARATLMLTGTLVFAAVTIVLAVYQSMSDHRVCAVFDAHPDYSYSFVRKESERIMRHRRGETMVMVLSFIPWMLLSIVTFGVAFAAVAFPYYLLTDACMADRTILEEHMKEEMAEE